MHVTTDFNNHKAAMEQGTVLTDDGVRLVYQTFGQGPAVVFANGIGVRYCGAIRQINALRESYRVVCWDYRGMGQSVMADPESDITMGRQAEDILTILDHLEIPSAIFIGWSMGVQVSLEVIRRQPGRVGGFISMFGTHGMPFRTGLPTPLARLVEGFFGFGYRVPVFAQGLLDFGVAFPRFTHFLMSSIRFTGHESDPKVFAADVQSVADVEKRLYLRTMLSLAEHDASDVLSRVPCPALIICGEYDWLTPPKVAREMAERIPDASFREVVRGTHFALIEQVALINGWIVDFVDRIYVGQDSNAGA